MGHVVARQPFTARADGGHRPLQTALPIYCTQNSTKKQLLFHEIDRAPQIGGVGQRDLRGQAVGVGGGRGGQCAQPVPACGGHDVPCRQCAVGRQTGQDPLPRRDQPGIAAAKPGSGGKFHSAGVAVRAGNDPRVPPARVEDDIPRRSVRAGQRETADAPGHDPRRGDAGDAPPAADKLPQGGWTYSCMARHGQQKFITCHRDEIHNQLFDVIADPDETTNLADAQPDETAAFAAAAARRVDFAAAEALQKRHAAAAAVLAKAETGAGGDDRERYRDYPSAAKEAPQYCVTNLTSAPGKSQTYEFYGLPDVNN